MKEVLTALDTVRCFWLHVFAVFLQSRVQAHELVHRQLVLAVDLRASVVVDIFACRGIVAAYEVAYLTICTLLIPCGRLAIVSGKHSTTAEQQRQ